MWKPHFISTVHVFLLVVRWQRRLHRWSRVWDTVSLSEEWSTSRAKESSPHILSTQTNCLLSSDVDSQILDKFKVNISCKYFILGLDQPDVPRGLILWTAAVNLTCCHAMTHPGWDDLKILLHVHLNVCTSTRTRYRNSPWFPSATELPCLSD